jgi:hypothetical protein
MLDEALTGTMRKNIKKYEEPLYVKYLTPVEQIKELADFIAKMNDMSTLQKYPEEEKVDNGSDYSHDIDQQLQTVNIGN